MPYASKASLSGLFFVAAISLSDTAAASPERVLYNFPRNAAPYGRVLEDNGNFFATSLGPGNGAAYMVRQKRGKWNAVILHQFGSDDGHTPRAGVVRDPNDGSLFGTTYVGGAHGLGTLYVLTPEGHGWTETVLHDFDGSDGKNPIAELRRDGATNVLYGTTSGGGSGNCGTAFQFDPATSQFKVLYQFAGGSDGCTPTVQLRPGSKAGTLVGATQSGGGNNCGTIFLLTQKGGNWKESVLHPFQGPDGVAPSDLDVADDGSVYGVASGGGNSNDGVVFHLVPGRTWKYEILFNFQGADGSRPVGINIQDGGKTIYGTTEVGGYGLGVVFRLKQVGGVWQEKTLYKFNGGNLDGWYPKGRPATDPVTGNLYGTTSAGGLHNGGTFYSVTP